MENQNAENLTMEEEEDTNKKCLNLLETINKIRTEYNEMNILNNALKDEIDNKKNTVNKLNLMNIKAESQKRLRATERNIFKTQISSETKLVTGLMLSTLDKLYTKRKQNSQKYLIDNNNDNEITEIIEFYKSIPIVKELSKLEEEYVELETNYLKSSKAEYAQLVGEYNMEIKKRNECIVRLVTRAKTIEQTELKISNVAMELKAGIEERNNKICLLKKELSTLNLYDSEIAEVADNLKNCSLNHTSLFKIPFIPKIIMKTPILHPNKLENEKKSQTDNEIKPKKKKPTRSFSILPLTRPTNSFLELKEEFLKSKVIENELIKLPNNQIASSKLNEEVVDERNVDSLEDGAKLSAEIRNDKPLLAQSAELKTVVNEIEVTHEKKCTESFKISKIITSPRKNSIDRKIISKEKLPITETITKPIAKEITEKMKKNLKFEQKCSDPKLSGQSVELNTDKLKRKMTTYPEKRLKLDFTNEMIANMESKPSIKKAQSNPQSDQQKAANNNEAEMIKLVQQINSSSESSKEQENLSNFDFEELNSPLGTVGSNSEGSDLNFEQDFTFEELNSIDPQSFITVNDLDFSSDNPFEAICDTFKF